MRKLMLAIALAALAACNANPPPDRGGDSATTGDPAQAPVPSSPAPVEDAGAMPPADADKPAFVDRVWRALNDSVVAAGTTYVFHEDGTLMVTSPNATPMSGSWDYRNQQLTMVEEGIAYPVDIVRMDTNHFTIRSHNPAGAVTIELMAAPDIPLPQLQ